ncbi:MAG: hypothetical protein IK108_12355 [Clostridia bacterium]|nr:hypothetical protein [Clostridia bacterium]
MFLSAETIKEALTGLLTDWCGALIRLQREDGGILCPACGRVHGRCHEAVYPFLYLADKTGDGTYLTAAKKAFRWGGRLCCPDGGMLNDEGALWKGVTVFAAAALHDALYYHGHLLEKSEKTAWETRLSAMGAWLYENLKQGYPAYINYYAAGACAMALLGGYFGSAAYTARAKELAAYCFGHVSENGLLYGEGKPHGAITAKGCRAFDIGGYNAEESLPSLYRYANVSGDGEALQKCEELMRAQLHWMLPDGGWDNATGTRNFKWTYWGGRTSDGCQDALFRLGKRDPAFAEAAWRNLLLLQECTRNGLLYGGPDYARHKENPCVHHAFCHAKTITAALENGICGFERVPLPADHPQSVRFYPELDTYRIAVGGWRADITGCDFPRDRGGHASGGAMCLLWHEKTGALIASGAVDTYVREPHNQQPPVRPEEHRCACPRIETDTDGVSFAQTYDYGARMKAAQTPEGASVTATAFLCDETHKRMPGDGACGIGYTFTPEAVTVNGRVSPDIGARFVLPVSGNAAVEVLCGTAAGEPGAIFSMSPGFIGQEYVIRPDDEGRFTVKIRPKKEKA